MLSDNEKISLRQAILIFFVIFFTSAIRFIPSFSAQKAKQAAWLAPVAAFFVILLLFIILQSLFKKYKNHSLSGVFESILGKIPGKLLTLLYIAWLIIPLSLFTRYYVERLLSSIFPSVDIRVFLLVMLAVVAYTLRSGIVIIARMAEIVFTIIIVTFILLVIFSFPQFKLERVTPLSYIDIIPVFKASIGVIAIFSYVAYMFFIGDRINNKENIKRLGIKASIFLTAAASIIILTVVGTMGYSLVARLPLPFLASVKLISIFNTLEKIESIVVVLWVSADFILISAFTFIILDMIKHSFKLSESKPLIGIFLTFIYISSLYICKSRFELESFSANVGTPFNILFGIIIPIIVFLVGKVRRKI